MSNIHQYRIVNKLKEIERSSHAGKRFESSAEHTWGTMMLAEYFLELEKDKHLNREKVFSLLLYHDLVEIESGDTSLDNLEGKKDQEKREWQSMQSLAKKLPSPIKERFLQNFKEFLSLETKESRFCKAIDRIEGTLQEMDYKEDWKGWTETFLRKNTEHHYKEFPSIKAAFEELIVYANENGFFTQK